MEYQRLNLSEFETRFLRILEPGPLNSPVRAEIVTASLTNAPTYSALSYTWGTERSSGCIQIDGQNVSIAGNLEAGLMELGLPRGALVWIDSLCINQQDLYEKSYQVGIMGEIYARADTVIAWLGDAKASTEQAFILLDSIEEVLKTGSSSGSDFGKRCLTGALRTSNDPSRALRGLVDLLTRPFWARVWIIQEIAKAKRVDVRCGRFQTGLKPIWTVFNHVPRIGLETTDLLDAIQRFRSSQQNIQADGITLLEALLMTKRSRATEPRDRVYALLSLTTDGHELVPLPDYSTSLVSAFGDISMRILARKRQPAIMLLASRTLISWQSIAVDVRSQVAVQWTELQEYVPQWVIRSVLQLEKTPRNHTFSVRDSHIKVSAAFIGTIVDCEDCPPETHRDSAKEVDDIYVPNSRISNIVLACMIDVVHICAELNPGHWATRDSKKYSLETFAHQLKRYRRGERDDGQRGITISNLLLSPFQRLGPLRYQDNKLWSMAAWHEKEHYRRLSRSSAVSSITSRAILPMSNEEMSPWNKVEAQLEDETTFGMQFGVVQREVSITKAQSSGFHRKPMKATDHVYCGVGLVCKKARVGDVLFLLPGLRLPVVLRSTTTRLRYHLIGDCILRVKDRTRPAEDIYIETKNQEDAKDLSDEVV